MTEDMVAVVVCDRFKWTYDEYLDTPRPFVLNVLAMIWEENAEIRRKQK